MNMKLISTTVIPILQKANQPVFTFYNSVRVPISGGYICWDGEKKGFKKIKAFPHVFSYAFSHII